MGNKFITLFRKYGVYLALASLWVFYDSSSFVLFGEIGWKILILIVFSRPLADVFPKIKFFNFLVSLRGPVGIICGTFIIAHSLGYFLDMNFPLYYIFDPFYWNLTNFYGWGMIGFVTVIPLTITSNKYSMRLLKRNWKRVQRFTYLFFISGAVHIALVNEEQTYIMIGLVIAWIILWILAYKKIILWK